jgi:hypothetical protein
MLRALVAVLPGPALPAHLVEARPNVTIVRFDTATALLERAAIEAVGCVIADGAVLDERAIPAIRAACPEATLCVVASRPVAGVDSTLGPDDRMHERVAAFVRFALGEPMRCGPRVPARGTLRIGRRPPLPIVDIGEGGVRAGSPPRAILGDAELRIELDDGPAIVARGREIRRERTSVVFALNALVARDRTALRRWLLGRRPALSDAVTVEEPTTSCRAPHPR